MRLFEAATGCLPIVCALPRSATARPPHFDDRPVSIGLPPILESYCWKTLLNSADIKACLAFATDHEKTDPPWLLSTSGFFFYPNLLKPEILT
ncbi:hypothetical protein QUB70_15075 [Microcoleus sp. A003_D6]